MPVRQSIALLAGHDYPERTAAQKFQLMVLGGSQGAKVFAEVIPQAVAELPESQQKKLRIFQQCRDCDVKSLQEAYAATKAEVTVSHFFGNMDELYAGTHLIISRAGASSVSEIAVAGVPSILVPAADCRRRSSDAECRRNQQSRGGHCAQTKRFYRSEA